MEKEKSITIQFKQFDAIEELSQKDQELLNKAIESSKSAYAPYSNFNVGAAVRLEDDLIIAGSNQENAAYPSGLCAERVALFAASANHPNKTMIALAVYAKGMIESDDQISPCGSCRQVMNEYEVKQTEKIKVLLMNSKGMVWTFESTLDLLPFAFTSKALKKA
jgi:cytidine deaminase